MSVTVYKALKHRILAGKKIYHNNTWKTLPDNAKMYLNGAWHSLGFGSGSVSGNSGLVFDNGAEPSTGTKWYITPNGTGNMDGTSWANAASGSMIHVILASCSSGDSVYIAEGNYTTDRSLNIPSGVTIYGGFSAVNPTWNTRNGFVHASIFTGNRTLIFKDGSTIVDGLVINNYSSAGTSCRNCLTIGGRFDNYCEKCIAINSNTQPFGHFSKGCVAINCTGGDRIFYYDSTGCVAINCSVISYGLATIFEGGSNTWASKNCIAVNCSSRCNNSTSYDGYYRASIFEGGINCTAVNCSVTGILAGVFVDQYNSSLLKNCVSWNNSYKDLSGNKGDEFRSVSPSDKCAGSGELQYNSLLALVLGTDNSIARFTNTGFYPAQGVQDVGDCPSPITDPTGFFEWIAAFGDWHPLANSFLVGRGTADSDVTTDADGVTRPDPPTIGAYEPVPVNA